MDKIVFLNQSYIKSAVKLHRLVFPGKLLTLLDQSLLEKIYYLLLSTPEAYLLGFLKENSLVGVVICAYSTPQLLKTLVFKIITRPLIFIQCFYQIIIHPQIIFQSFSLLLYPSKNSLNLPEILVIAVDKQCRRQNIGTQLIRNLEENLQKKKVSRYKVSVESTNKAGQRFYHRLGFKRLSTLSQFGRTWFVLVKKISQ